MYLRQVLFRFTFTAAAHLLLLLCRKITLKRKITLMIRLQLRKVWSHSTRRGGEFLLQVHSKSSFQPNAKLAPLSQPLPCLKKTFMAGGTSYSWNPSNPFYHPERFICWCAPLIAPFFAYNIFIIIHWYRLSFARKRDYENPIKIKCLNSRSRLWQRIA